MGNAIRQVGYTNIHVRLGSAINNIERGFDCIVSGFGVSMRFPGYPDYCIVHTYNY